MSGNIDAQLGKQGRRIMNRVKEIQDAYNKKYGDKEEDYDDDEDEYY